MPYSAAYAAIRVDLNRVVYLAIVLGVFNHRIVGWSMTYHLRTELVLGALGHHCPYGVVHHSDKDSQYTSLAFGKRCREMGMLLSAGSAATALITPRPRASLPHWSVSSSIGSRETEVLAGAAIQKEKDIPSGWDSIPRVWRILYIQWSSPTSGLGATAKTVHRNR